MRATNQTANHQNRVLATQAALAGLALLLLLGAAARAVQSPIEEDSLEAADAFSNTSGGAQTTSEVSNRVVASEGGGRGLAFQAQGGGGRAGQARIGRAETAADAKESMLIGTIVADGADEALRAKSGKMYRLDQTPRVKPFEGRSVRVRGRLDETSGLLHVQAISSTES